MKTVTEYVDALMPWFVEPGWAKPDHPVAEKLVRAALEKVVRQIQYDAHKAALEHAAVKVRELQIKFPAQARLLENLRADFLMEGTTSPETT